MAISMQSESGNYSDMDLFDSPVDRRRRQRDLSPEIALQGDTGPEKSAEPKRKHGRTRSKGSPARKRLSTTFYGSTKSKKSSHGPGHPSRLQPLIYSSSSDSEKEEGEYLDLVYLTVCNSCLLTNQIIEGETHPRKLPGHDSAATRPDFVTPEKESEEEPELEDTVSKNGGSEDMDVKEILKKLCEKVERNSQVLKELQQSSLKSRYVCLYQANMWSDMVLIILIRSCVSSSCDSSPTSKRQIPLKFQVSDYVVYVTGRLFPIKCLYSPGSVQYK